ncbi:hypothetical protein LTS10_007974 [Elasticomyces elasticus]|nr:hypothetical protein LTS10_007974 [Elasticomyces elasticus]
MNVEAERSQKHHERTVRVVQSSMSEGYFQSISFLLLVGMELTLPQEGRQSTINLPTPSSDPAEDTIGLDDPAAIRIMIDYVYHDDYKMLPTRVKQGEKRTTPEDDRTLCTHVSVFAAAVKYGMPDLRNLAAACYVEIVRGQFIKNIAVSDIAQAIRTAHSMIPPDVRDLHKATSRMLLDHPTILRDERIATAIQETPRAGYEMLLEWHDYVSNWPDSAGD